jgi:hypothetical protein
MTLEVPNAEAYRAIIVIVLAAGIAALPCIIAWSRITLEAPAIGANTIYFCLVAMIISALLIGLVTEKIDQTTFMYLFGGMLFTVVIFTIASAAAGKWSQP